MIYNVQENWEVLEFIIKLKNFNINQADSKGCYPLWRAIDLSKPKLAKIFIDNGANPHIDGTFMCAVRRESFELVQLLISCGVKYSTDAAIMILTAKGSSVDLFNFFLDRGGDALTVLDRTNA